MYFHVFFLTATPKLYTLLHSVNTINNTYKETENRSSWGTQFMYNFLSSICSYSKMMTSNLSWYHNINMSTSVCYCIFFRNTFFKGAWRDPDKVTTLICTRARNCDLLIADATKIEHWEQRFWGHTGALARFHMNGFIPWENRTNNRIQLHHTPREQS